MMTNATLLSVSSMVGQIFLEGRPSGLRAILTLSIIAFILP